MSQVQTSASANNSAPKAAQNTPVTQKKDEILTVQVEEIKRPDVNQVLEKLEKANKLRANRTEFKKKVDEYEAFGHHLAEGVGFRVVYQTYEGAEVEFLNMEVLTEFYAEQMKRANEHLAKLDAELIAAMAA